ncbi:MAG: hypothetical protein KAR47_00185 [Planctomycetes bacterium]|nr:hypothetical protein [Planctomycetota bacterium]
MDLTLEQQRRIVVIKAEMVCPKGFSCCCHGTGYHPRVQHVGNLLECFEAEARGCLYSFSFGLGYFCRCSINRYLHECQSENNCRWDGQLETSVPDGLA